MWVLLAVSLALLLVAPVAMKGLLSKRTAQLPDSIEGYTRVDDDQNVDRVKDQLVEAARQEGASAMAAVYRQSGKLLLVEVHSGMSPASGAGDLLTTLAGKLHAASTTVDTSQMTLTSGEDGATQACAPMTGDLAGSVCYWTDVERVGLVMGLSIDPRETGLLAEAVRIAVDA